ncbi:MAG TPA: hypothetical protein PLK12_13290 [Prolixibacteraceae bacterium]|nr:hypothetical protein [Prolixibacteraceae bacterium]
MKEPEIITYKGKTIVYLDFTNMKNKDEIIALENKGAEYIRRQAPKSALTLTNMENMFFNNELKSWFADMVKGNAPYVKAGAVLGMSGLISIMYNAFLQMTGRNIKAFKTKEEALEYLVSF